MQDRFEQQQDEYYRKKKEKDAKNRKIVSTHLRHIIYLLVGNAFALAVYVMFVSRIVNEKLLAEEDPSGVVCVFGLIAQILILVITSALEYGKNEEERRALLHASREDGFAFVPYYINTWKRMAWTVPSAYAIMQVPFMLYYLLLGYFYPAETLFAKFHIPQLCLFEWTGSGILGVILNTVLISVIWAVCMYGIQRSWLRDRIRV